MEYNLGRLRVVGWSNWKDMGPKERPKCNWIDMEVLRIQFERAYYKETFEVNFALLGFNLCLEWYLGVRGCPGS